MQIEGLKVLKVKPITHKQVKVISALKGFSITEYLEQLMEDEQKRSNLLKTV